MAVRDTVPQCVKDVLDKPGRYSFEEWTGQLWFFEVDSRHRVHQLNPRTLERDGVLYKDGWTEGARHGTVRRLKEQGERND